MKYSWVEEYCLRKKGVRKEYKAEWDVIRYMIEDKMFVMQGQDNKENDILTVKLESLFGEMLRKQFEEITPGYYMNKVHWNSMKLEGNVPDHVVKEMLDQSYQLVLASFSKKKQAEIQNNGKDKLLKEKENEL